MLLVTIPRSYRPERHYVLDVVLDTFLGVEYNIRDEERSDVCITCPGHRGALYLNDALFATPANSWMTAASLPEQPLSWWEVDQSVAPWQHTSRRVPVLYGDEPASPDFFARGDHDIRLGLDVLGSIFFMLTRYEEATPGARRDTHERFPAAASIAYQGGFLERPVVDEYVEILWGCFRHLWPRLERQSRTHEVQLSYDVDWPAWNLGKSPFALAKTTAGDIIRRGDPRLALRRMWSYFPGRFGKYSLDPANTFRYILDTNARFGARGTFNLFALSTIEHPDGMYSLSDTWIRRIISDIHEHGHRIGLHGSYWSYCDSDRLEAESNRLRRTLADLGIVQNEIGGRQHYLRWTNPATWQAWEDSGLTYDSTIGFADHVGFRAGTCFEYPVFNLLTRTPLRLRERPLVAMEVSLLQYMGLSHEETIERIRSLRDACKELNAPFTLLWHNDKLEGRLDRRCYENVMAVLFSER